MTLDELARETAWPVVMVDQRGSIIRVNAQFERIFGWTISEIVGRPLTTIIPGNLHDAHNLGFSRFLVTRKPTLLNQPLKLTAVKKSGQEFDAEHTIIAEERDGQWLFGATIKPL